ncbi:MAG: homocysteine biosynthesis protein, partial [Actinomycetota bacterium]
DIFANIYDYSVQRRNKPVYGKVNYRELRSGKITINKKEVPTGSISSYPKAREIASILKDWIKKGSFTLTQPVENLPMQGMSKPLKIVSEDEL